MNETDSLSAKDDVVFALLGRAATNLSYLEFTVSELLQSLLAPNEPIVSAIVAEEMTLAKRIQNIKKLAAFRFILDEKIRNQLLDLASRLDKLRSKRNLFVHGQWRLMPTPTGGVTITCVDYRWDIDAKIGRSWSRFREQNWSEEELKDFIQHVRDITQETLDQTSHVRRKMKEMSNKGIESDE